MNRRAALEQWLQRVWSGDRPVLAWLLLPLSLFWRLGSAMHRALYATGLREVVQLGAPVISVGNLVAGGSGKTPVALELASRLVDAGRKVAVVSRGYGRRSRGVVIISDGQALRTTAEEGGDEPVWIARKDPRLIVVVGEKRAEAAATALELGADLVLLDDGLSHYGLRRDLDVVVIDDGRRFENGHFLPAGPLRLPTSVAAGADLIWWTRVLPEDQRLLEPAELRSRPSVHSEYAPQRLVDLELQPREELTTLRGRRVLAVCGIARPAGFEAALEQLGTNVRGLLRYEDHHLFSKEDVAHIMASARSERCDLIVTTEKDAVRLARVATGDQYRALAMETVVRDPVAIEALLRRFKAGPPAEAA